MLFDFYDRLKTITQGYGSFDYELIDYRETDLVKVDILVNGERVDALSQLVHRDKARPRALHYCERLAETIPRQQFKIAIQGAIGGTIIARTDHQRLPQGRHRQVLRRRHHAASASSSRSRRRARSG